MALLCYIEPEISKLKNYLTNGQRDLTADIVNKCILGNIVKFILFLINIDQMGLLDKSVLEVLLSHLTQIYERFQELDLHFGESFEFKV